MQYIYREEETLIHKRYTDILKLVTDIDELKLIQGTQVLIYRGDKWYDEVTVDLEGQKEQFEKLRPYIVSITKNLCEMDSIAQKYSRDSKFAFNYQIACIHLSAPDIISMRYFGMIENTEFDVVFQHINGNFILKSFGMVNNIPPDWDKKWWERTGKRLLRK